MWKIIIQSGHNFAHVQICDLIGSFELNLKDKEFWCVRS